MEGIRKYLCENYLTSLYYKACAIFSLLVVQLKEIFSIFEEQLLEIAKISIRLYICCTKWKFSEGLTN